MANPNPSPKTRFKKGQSGNPSGVSSEQRLREIENAKKATRAHSLLLDALVEQLEGGMALDHIEPSSLKLLKDAQDRGLGTARQSIEHTGQDGEPIKVENGTAVELAAYLASMSDRNG